MDKVYLRLHKCNCVVLFAELREGKRTVGEMFLNIDGQPLRKCPECKQVIKSSDLRKFPGIKYVLGQEMTAESIIWAANGETSPAREKEKAA